jgi:hypothetical protein
MSDTAVAITAGTGTNIDTRTEGTNGNHRQVIVVGDPATNAGVAPVDATAGLKVDLGADNDVTLATLPDTSGGDLAAITTATEAVQAAVEGTLTVGSHAVTNAGTFATQATLQAGTASIGKLAANSGVDIGDVDVLSLPASTNTLEVVGDAAENAAAAGNPVLTGGRYDLTPRTLGDGDVGAIALDADGAVQVSDGGNSLTVDGSLTVDLGANNDVTVTSGTVTANLGSTDNAVLDQIELNTDPLLVVGGGTEATAQRVTIANNSTGVLSVDDNGSSLTVDGTVTADLGAVDNAVLDSIAAATAATQAAVEGTLTVTGGGGGTEYTEDAAAAANPVGTTLQLIREDARAGSLTTADGDNVALRGNNKGEAYVKTTDSDALLTTIDSDTGAIKTATEATQNALETVGGLVVNLGANNDVTMATLPDTSSGDLAAINSALAGTLTVTGGGGTEYTEDVATANPQVGTATLIERDDALSTVTPIEGDWIGLRGTAEGALWTQDFNSDGILADTTAIKTSLETAGGQLVNLGANNDVTVTGTVDLGTVDNAVLDTIAAKDFATETTLAAMNAKMVTGTDIGDVTINNSTGAAAVNIQDGGNAITVDNGGTFAVQAAATLAAETSKVIGTVRVASGGIASGAIASGAIAAGAIAAGATSIAANEDDASANGDRGVKMLAVRKDTPANTSGTDGDYENPQMSAGRLWTSATIDTALPTGTNAIGKLAANSGVDIGDVDVTSLPALAAGTNAIGKVIPPDYDVTSHTAKAVKYYTNAGAATDGIIWSPAAGKRWHVTTLFINVSAAATVTIEDDLAAGDNAVMKMELAANSGVAIPFGDLYPLTSGEDAADLLITTSAGNVYVTAVGYEV